MKKMAYLKGLLRKLDNTSREFRQLQKAAPSAFDFSAFDEDEDRRNAEIKAEREARDAYHDIEMYMFCIKDISELDFPTMQEREALVDKELASIFHQNGDIEKAFQAIVNCL